MNLFSISRHLRWILLGVVIIFLSKTFLGVISKHTLLVFCDVGQGDGAYIRIQNRYDVLIDAGPSDQIVQCLGRHMPFYDKTIELAFLSHPQKDHFGGFSHITRYYHINIFATTEADVNNIQYAELLNTLKRSKSNLIYLYAGDKLRIEDATFKLLSPTKKFIDTTHPIKDANDASQVMLLQTPFTSVLFTGDSTPKMLAEVVEKYQFKSNILKVPHHGSRNGLIEEFLTLANPTVAVISAGKNNNYGHPAETIMNMLKRYRVIIRRTDIEGDIAYRY